MPCVSGIDAFAFRHAHGCAGASFAESGCTVPGLSSLWALLTACLFLYRAVCAYRLRACLAPRRCFRASFVLPCSAFFFRVACHLLCTRLFRRYGKAGASSWRHGSLAFVSRHALGCAGASFAEGGCTVPGLSSLWASLTACLFLYRAVCASRLQACLAPRQCFRASFILPCSAFFFRVACHLLCTRLFRRYGKAGASSWRHGSLAFFSRHALGCAGASFAESGCTVPEQSSLWASLTACLSLYRAVCASRLRACLASPVWMPSPSDTPLAVLEPTA